MQNLVERRKSNERELVEEAPRKETIRFPASKAMAVRPGTELSKGYQYQPGYHPNRTVTIHVRLGRSSMPVSREGVQ